MNGTSVVAATRRSSKPETIRYIYLGPIRYPTTPCRAGAIRADRPATEMVAVVPAGFPFHPQHPTMRFLPLRGPHRPSPLLLGSLSVVAVLLAGCTPDAPPPPPPPPLAQNHDLHFDMRYYDSIEMEPQSERTKREAAIYKQLERLRMAQPHRNKQGKTVPMPKAPNDSLYEQIGEGKPARGWANAAERLADIHHQMDSLKVLEHIPITPY